MVRNPITEWQKRRRQKQEQVAEEARERLAALIKEGARAGYLKAGGSASEFEAAWPKIHARIQLEEAERKAKKRQIRKEE